MDIGIYKTHIKATKHELMQMYYDDGMSQKEIGELYGVNSSSISLWMKSYGIESRAKMINSLKPSKNKLGEMYWINQMSIPEIADEIGVGHATVFDWMQSHEIKTRTISESRIGRLAGENSPHWKGGISFEPYCKRFNNEFKKSVRERDDYTCQLCGHEQLLNGKKLDVHHIHYDKENCWPDVVVLCRSCNAKVNFNRDYWEQYFENQLFERGLIHWSLSQET